MRKAGEDEDKIQSRVENTIRLGDEEVAGITSPLTKGNRGRYIEMVLLLGLTIYGAQ